MFEPLPSIVRRRREERNLTQDRLAKLAKVSRGQLIAFEKGEQNVTLHFLMKIARALELKELPLAELNFAPAVPELTVLIAAADALANARTVVAQAAAAARQVDEATASIRLLLEHALEDRASHPGLAAAAARLAPAPAEQGELSRALRAVAEAPDAPPRRAARSRSAPKATARKRTR